MRLVYGFATSQNLRKRPSKLHLQLDAIPECVRRKGFIADNPRVLDSDITTNCYAIV
jgi:hypothetical protein